MYVRPQSSVKTPSKDKTPFPFQASQILSLLLSLPLGLCLISTLHEAKDPLGWSWGTSPPLGPQTQPDYITREPRPQIGFQSQDTL